jgi:hypothetical protein
MGVALNVMKKLMESGDGEQVRGVILEAEVGSKVRIIFETPPFYISDCPPAPL